MGRFTKKLALGAAVILMASMFPVAVMAADGQTVRDFPGWNGSGTKIKGPVEGSESFDFWDDDDDGGPGSYSCPRGWRYSPSGWWFQYSDGSWPSNSWKYIDGRWYRFNWEGHMITGWFSDEGGLRDYLNPVDDGTLGAMRIGWQIIDGKAYCFNTKSDGYLGKLLTNTTTPDGYKVGADGAWIP